MTTQSHFPSSPKKGFTLIELLTVIAIIAILLAITIPIVSDFRKTARKTADMSNLRQIANASLMYASENNEALPQSDETVGGDGVVTTAEATDIKDVAGVLAVSSGLNDISIWISSSDDDATEERGLVVVGSAGEYDINSSIDDAGETFSFDYVANLTMAAPPSTPIAFTRKSDLGAGQWTDGDDIYGAEGGHVVFVGGNVQWYQTLQENLYDGIGGEVNSINAALNPGNMPGNIQPAVATAAGIEDVAGAGDGG